MRAFACALVVALAFAACGGSGGNGGEATTATDSTSTSPEATAPAVTGSGYDQAGYHLEPVDPASIGFTAPAGAVTSATAFRVTRGGELVGTIVQAIPPEDQPPTEDTLVQILSLVADGRGGSPEPIVLGETSGYAVRTDDGKVVVAHLLEDGSLQFTFGTDQATLAKMIEDLNTSQPGGT